MADAITARGFIVSTPGEPGVVEEFSVPAPGPGEARIRMLASGVCHTDLTVKNGLSRRYQFPALLGHEGAGIVEAIGDGVDTVIEGDHVILAYRAPCGVCRLCTVGKPHRCVASLEAMQTMTTRDGTVLMPVLGLGTFCTHTLVHARQCIPIDKALPPEQMSLIGCGVMTGVGAALYTAGVEPGQSVAVIGCGGVGDSVIMGAKLAGATTIIAVDIDPRKLAWAEGFGATHTVNPHDGDAVAAIKAITGGYGVDASFEAVGRPDTLLTAIWARDLGGTCVLIGVADPRATVTFPMYEFFSVGGAVKTSWYGDCLPTRDFPVLADWYAQGRLDLDGVVTRIITLDEVEEAFQAMERGDTLRSVIRF